MIRENALVQRLTVLWFIILVGLIYHVILHLVPIFYGIDVEKTDSTGSIPVLMVLTYSLSFFIPALGILTVQYSRRKIGALLNLVLCAIAFFVCTGHLSEIIITRAKHIEQVFVISTLFVVSLLLVRDAIKWFRNK